MFELFEHDPSTNEYKKRGAYLSRLEGMCAFFLLPIDNTRKLRDGLNKEIVVAANAGTSSFVRNPGYFRNGASPE